MAEEIRLIRKGGMYTKCENLEEAFTVIRNEFFLGEDELTIKRTQKEDGCNKSKEKS